MVEVSGDERLRGGPCSPGANGPTGVPPVSVHPRGELLGHPRGTARRWRAGRAQGLLALPRVALLPCSEQAGRASGPPRCSLARTALLAYPGAARRGGVAFSRARVLAWCEHLLSDDDGHPRGGMLAGRERPLLAEVEQPPGQSLAEGKGPLPAKGEQPLCIILGPLFRRCWLAPHC